MPSGIGSPTWVAGHTRRERVPSKSMARTENPFGILGYFITSPALHTMGTSCLPPAGSGGISGTNRRSPCVGAVGSISVGAVFEPFRHQIVNDVEGVQRALLPQALG